MHFSGLFILVFPPIIVWMFKKNEIPEFEQHFKDIMNFQLSVFIYLMGSAILLVVLIGLPLLMFWGLFSQILIILNTIKVMNHQSYRYPFSIQILK